MRFLGIKQCVVSVGQSMFHGRITEDRGVKNAVDAERTSAPATGVLFRDLCISDGVSQLWLIVSQGLLVHLFAPYPKYLKVPPDLRSTFNLSSRLCH